MRLKASKYIPILKQYDWDVPTALAVMMAESAGDPRAANPKDNHGQWVVKRGWRQYGSWGLFQCGSFTVDSRKYKDADGNTVTETEQLFDPATNIAVAHQIYKEHHKRWSAWGAYTSGAYNKFINEAEYDFGDWLDTQIPLRPDPPDPVDEQAPPKDINEATDDARGLPRGTTATHEASKGIAVDPDPWHTVDPSILISKVTPKGKGIDDAQRKIKQAIIAAIPLIAQHLLDGNFNIAEDLTGWHLVGTVALMIAVSAVSYKLYRFVKANPTQAAKWQRQIVAFFATGPGKAVIKYGEDAIQKRLK